VYIYLFVFNSFIIRMPSHRAHQHELHDDAPAYENELTGQGVQVDDPARVEKVPSGHRVHLSAPMSDLLPGGHGVHVDAKCDEKVPGPQGEHDEAPWNDHVPARHVPHECHISPEDDVA